MIIYPSRLLASSPRLHIAQIDHSFYENQRCFGTTKGLCEQSSLGSVTRFYASPRLKMERIRLKPTYEQVLAGDANLKDLMRYTEHLVSNDDDRIVAHNAALVYKALITAFEKRGLLQCAWAPRLAIDVGPREYEVRCIVPCSSLS